MVCDLAETYKIYNYKDFEINYIAKLVRGLSQSSRVFMHLNDSALPVEQMLLAGIADRLGLLLWQNTDGRAKMPDLILDNFAKKEKETCSYYSAEDFERARKEMLSE